MKVLQINSVYGLKSTGRIAYDLVQIQNDNSIESCVVSGEGKFSSSDIHVMSGKLYQKLNILCTRLFGRHGFYNRFATKRMLKFVKKQSPDVIHLHNIHGHYINIKMLFDYISRNNIPVVWTLHDCWAFTGHCPHFDYIGCDKWHSGCGNCPQKRGYPGSLFFDRSAQNFRDKKALFTSVQNMHIVTPSAWLASLAQQSYLSKYPISVIHNGIDTDIFNFTPSDIKKKLSLDEKFIILGMVSDFTSTKGGRYFLELSKMLNDDEHIVLVSLADTENLPDNITAIARTENAQELAKYYSMADVFVNPTLQDTFPTVNLESLACGLPVVTFRTGGSPETITEGCGFVVEKGDTTALYEAVQKVRCGEVSKEECRKRGREFNRYERFSEYIPLYRQLADKD